MSLYCVYTTEEWAGELHSAIIEFRKNKCETCRNVCQFHTICFADFWWICKGKFQTVNVYFCKELKGKILHFVALFNN